jgi:hypothetical protein
MNIEPWTSNPPEADCKHRILYSVIFKNGPIYNIKDRWYPIEVPALGFDLGIELTISDSFSRLGRGTKPNNRGWASLRRWNSDEGRIRCSTFNLFTVPARRIFIWGFRVQGF